MAALSDYLATLRQLVHDSADVLVPVSDKTAYINAGMQQRDFLTGGNRIRSTVACSTVTDTYTYTQLGNANIIDIIGINCLDGQFRFRLQQFSLTRLNAFLRTSTLYKDRPSAYAWAGQSILLNCIASSATFSLETDCTVLSPALVNLGDTDPLPPPWTNPVPYYAAFRAKLNARRPDEAEGFKKMFAEKCALIPGMRVGMLTSIR